MMNNKEIIEKLATAFEENDNEAIMEYMADDIQWHMLADRQVFDKKAMRRMFAENPMEIVSITKENFIADGDTVAVNGDVLCRDQKSGKEYDLYYCDIYELENGKVKKMISYTLDKKGN